MAETTASDWELLLLGGWQLQHHGIAVTMARREQRLLACLALLGRRPRQFLRGLLWPDSSEAQASGNMRTAVWRTQHLAPSILFTESETLELNQSVRIDVAQLRIRISRLSENSLHPHPWSEDFLNRLAGADLLPGWYDDWVIFEQEKLLQSRLDALEQMAQQSLTANNPSRAISAALAATSIEPLRESAQLLLIRAHLIAGNRASAIHAYRRFSTLLSHELGVQPSRQLNELLNHGMSVR